MAVQDISSSGAVEILPSAARTATPTIQQFMVPANCREAYAIIDITAVTSTPSTTFVWAGYDPESTKTWALVTTSAITSGPQTIVMQVSSNLTAVGGTIAKAVLPRFITFTATHGNANSMTYSISMLV